GRNSANASGSGRLWWTRGDRVGHAFPLVVVAAVEDRNHVRGGDQRRMIAERRQGRVIRHVLRGVERRLRAPARGAVGKEKDLELRPVQMDQQATLGEWCLVCGRGIEPWRQPGRIDTREDRTARTQARAGTGGGRRRSRRARERNERRVARARRRLAAPAARETCREYSESSNWHVSTWRSRAPAGRL